MKQNLSVTKLLQRVWECMDNIEVIAKRIKEQKQAGFTVEFHHDKDLNLIHTGWSDQYNPHDGKNSWLIYRYEITSKGIHFLSFEEKEVGKPVWSQSVRYWSSSTQTNCSLISVPNKSPDPTKSMYTLHQEKIREALSILPAWAIAVMSN